MVTDFRRHAVLSRRSLRGLVLAAALLGPAARADEARAPVAVAARLIDEGGSASLTFDLSGPVEAKARAITAPERIIVDLPEVNFQIGSSVGKISSPRAGALVKAFRFGLFGPGKSRVVIELARPACPVKVETRPIAKGAAPSRLTVSLEHCEDRDFLAAAKAANPSPATPDPLTNSTTAERPVIVIDPGHGGIDSGASGAHGVLEKTIVYDYALALQAKLEATQKFKVVVTRGGDAFVSLGERVRIAHEAKAALFISIHADALSEADGDVSGTTVYTCSDRASDAAAARIAERENAADKAGGVDSKADEAGVADILFGLERRETRAYAHIFSRDLVAQWQGAGRLNHNPERSAGFVVLKAPDFPSVLVELGYLSNAQDVANMTSPEWRAKTANAMTNAVLRFFAPDRGASATVEKPSDALVASGKPNPEGAKTAPPRSP